MVDESGLDRDGDLDLDGGVFGEAGDGDGGAGVAAGLAIEFHEEIAGAVDYRGRVGEGGDGVDVAADVEKGLHAVERAERALDGGEDVERADLRGLAAGLDGVLAAHLADVGHLAVEARDDAREDERVAVYPMRHVAASGRGRGGQGETEGGEFGGDLGHER